MTLKEVSGKGTLFTFTTVHRAVAMDQQLPFIIAVIELDMSDIKNSNGVRLMSNIVDADLSELQIGKGVDVVWETMSDEVSVPRFKLSN